MGAEGPWELFQAGHEPRDVPREVLTSWRRSRFSGVDPEYVEVPFVETDLDSQFSRVATPIMAGMAELLVGDRSCLALSDASGSVIWRWVSEPMLRHVLDDLSVSEGFNFGEEVVGTNGLGTALETGGLAVVRGSEHYVHRFHDVTCVAAPVRHPITRRTVGAVNVTCRAADTNSLLTVVVRKLAAEIRTALHDRSTRRERQLLSAFLRAQRRASGPVAVVGDDLIITNQEAADLGLDRRAIWDEIRSRRGGPDRSCLALPAEATADLTLEVTIVRDGNAPAGAVLTVPGPAGETPPAATRSTTRRAVRGAPRSAVRGARRSAVRGAPRGAPEVADTDGHHRLAEQARAAFPASPLAVIGENGTGKATILQDALDEDPGTLDAATYALDPAGWLAELRSGGDHPVVLRHLELLDTAGARAVASALTDAPRRAPLGLTITVAEGETPPAPARLLVDALTAATLAVPPLRRAPDTVVSLARAELGRHDPALRFAPDALAALRRHHWPGNLAELVRVVRDAAHAATGDTLGLATLSADVRDAHGRRALTPLEHAEASVIASVLREHDGNKSTAARTLGISRTALYSKIRRYRL